MTTYLLKTEPSDYSYDDLVRDGSTVWDGVANNAALNNIRKMRNGDLAYIYHTGDEKRIAGLATVTSGPYEDPENPGQNARGEPKLAVVDVKPLRAAKNEVTLKMVKADERFSDFKLVRVPRLSVMEVPEEFDGLLREMTGL